MPYLDLYTQLLTAKTAAHLLRRTTFGPTQAEITAFTGQTAAQAVQTLISNCNFNPPQPVDYDETATTAGQLFLQNATTPAGQFVPFVGATSPRYRKYIGYWWLNLMIQPGPVNLLDKLTLFWQNHFVTTREDVADYRYVWTYLKLLRDNALGNFPDLVKKITKDPAMLRYLDGRLNEAGVGKANENYARELQELFTVGVVDFAGNPNYTEDDVKAAARALTGWKDSGYYSENSTAIGTTFTSTKHDTANKLFSNKYGTNISITGRSGATAGDLELDDLVTILMNHPQTGRYICRKLYRWYVNDTVTQDIETNVIGPLATVFSSNNYNIQPVIEQLLTSQIFFDESNIGALAKSPAEFVVGMMRFYELPVTPPGTSLVAFRKTMEYLFNKMRDIQLELMEQPTVFGYDAYYQTGFTKLWCNTNTMAVRSDLSDRLVNSQTINSGTSTVLNINPLARIQAFQPNFGTIPTTGNPTAGNESLTCVQILDYFLVNLLSTELVSVQRDFLIDTIMMQNIPRTSWEFEWNLYRRTVTYPASYTASQITNARNAVQNRLRALLRSILRLAEYHIF
jgi:uncharacterized protein (DUF1800 family)